MTRPIEEESAEGHEQTRTAFGVKLSIDPRISIPGLGAPSASPLGESSTRIRLDTEELNQRWEALTTPPERARALYLDETLLLSVDFAEPAGYLMWAKDFGRILISPDGRELLCDPDPRNEDWSSILAAQALPLAATIRGLEVFHASGVVIDGRALLFAGQPGAGKSSLAAAFVREGALLLSDDAVALQLDRECLIAHAGSVALQLRAAEDEQLTDEQRASLGRAVSSSTGKHRYVSSEVPEPAPFAALFLLERSAKEPAIARLDAVNPFELIASTFNLSVRTPARLQRQLDVVSTIATQGLAYRLRVQPDVSASRLARILQAQLAASNA